MIPKDIDEFIIMKRFNDELDGIPCYCNKCDNLWIYRGNKEGNERISCSNCKRKQPLEKMRLDNNE
jgi:predicted ABC-type ATPase